MTSVSVTALAELVRGRVIGDGDRQIRGLADLRTAGPDQIGFVRDQRYRDAARHTNAGALLTAAELPTSAVQIVVADVNVAYARIAGLFHPQPQATEHTVHPTAVVDPEAELESPVAIGPRAVVGRCRVGAGTRVMAGVAIGDGAVIGRGCTLFPNTTVYPGVQIGDRVVLHANAVVGSDGFGYARDGDRWLKVPQLGVAIIDDDVEIGAGTTIDRGTLGATRIGPRVKIDNLCHIGHNCVIGADTAVAAGAMLAGSTHIGARCIIGGRTSFAGHLSVCDDALLGGESRVIRDVTEPGEYLGYPLLPRRRYLRLLARFQEMAKERGRGASP